MLEKYTKFLLKWRFVVILASLICILSCAYGMRLLHFSTDYRMFFSTENPNLVAFEALQNIYTKHDNVFFVLTPKHHDVFTEDTLKAVQWLTEQSWQLPYCIRVDSLTNYQHTQAEGDELYVNDLVPETFDFNPEALTKIKQISMNEPLLYKRMISARAHVTGVNATIQLPDDDLEKATPEVVSQARALMKRFSDRYPDIDIKLTGIVLQNHAFMESSLHDIATLTPVMLMMIFLGVGLFMRHWGAVLCVILGIGCSVVVAMGLAGYLGITLSPATVAAPTVMMTLAVADCVHLMSTYYWRIQEGDHRVDALIYSMKLNGMPIFLTSFTTVFGFLSLNFSDAPPFRDLGNVVAIGVAAAFFLTMTLIAALLSYLPATHLNAPDRIQSIFPRLGRFIIHKHKMIFSIVTVGMLSALIFLPKNQLNDEWIGYFDKDTLFRQAADYTLAELTGVGGIHYSLSAGASEGIYEPAYMQHIDAFTHWLKQQPEVIQVVTVTHVIKKLNQVMHQDDPAWYKIPESRELMAQYLLLYELSLPRGLDLNNQINIDKSATRVQVVLDKLTTNDLLNFEMRVQAWMQQHFPVEMITPGTSPDIMFAHIGFKNIRNLLGGAVIALFLISLVLCIAFRSVMFGVFSMLPNLLPIGVSFGLWGLFVGEIGLSLSVVAGMTLGIVVDDTIHFLSKYRYARCHNATPVEAVQYGFNSVGKALFVTSFVLVCGFLVLGLSDFKLNASMGLLTAITIAIAIVIDFFWVPPLLLLIEGKYHALFGFHRYAVVQPNPSSTNA